MQNIKNSLPSSRRVNNNQQHLANHMSLRRIPSTSHRIIVNKMAYSMNHYAFMPKPSCKPGALSLAKHRTAISGHQHLFNSLTPPLKAIAKGSTTHSSQASYQTPCVVRSRKAYFIYLKIHPCQIAGFLISFELGNLSHLWLLIAFSLFSSPLEIRESSLAFAAAKPWAYLWW